MRPEASRAQACGEAAKLLTEAGLVRVIPTTGSPIGSEIALLVGGPSRPSWPKRFSPQHCTPLKPDRAHPLLFRPTTCRAKGQTPGSWAAGRPVSQQFIEPVAN